MASCAIVILTAGISVAAASAAPGDLDPGFSVDGKVTRYDDGFLNYTYTSVFEPDFQDAALGPNGTIVVAGDSGIHRFRPRGAEDTAFSPDDGDVVVTAVAVQPDGKVVAAGYTSPYTPGSDFNVLRYNRNGTLDAGFGTNGHITTNFGGYDQARSIAIQPDGKLVVVGSSIVQHAGNTVFDFAIARYEPDGSPDSSFSTDGRATVDFGGNDVARDVAVQPNGKLVVGGSAAHDLAVARLMPDGKPDASFSGDGKAVAGFADPNAAGGQALALQPDGKIVMAGEEDGQFALARFKPNGSLDRSFSGDGIVKTGITAPHEYPVGSAANDVVLQGQRILAAGTANGDFALAQYLPDGTLDPSFSGDGIVTTDFGQNDWGSTIVPQGNAIVVAGTSLYQPPRDFAVVNGALARYRMNDGPADADADGILNASDVCPNVYEPQAADGCPSYSRGISVEVRKHPGYANLVVDVSSYEECLDDARVDVYRSRHGQVKKIREGTLRLAGHGSERQRYDTRVRRTRGRVYVTVPEQLIPTFGHCGAVTSDRFNLRPG